MDTKKKRFVPVHKQSSLNKLRRQQWFVDNREKIAQRRKVRKARGKKGVDAIDKALAGS